MTFGRLERPRASRPMSDINMTPLIDVMLVLLVIFIVSAPLMASSIKLRLPAGESATPVRAAQVLAVTLTANGQMTVAGAAVPREEWAARFAEAARLNPQTELHLRADQAAPYGLVAELIGLAQKAGLTRIGFATDATGAAGPGPGSAAPRLAPEPEPVPAPATPVRPIS